jgi:glutamyl-tRNA synthetase
MYGKIRTRFAPSPTGFIHLGALRTALYAYCFAKQNGGTFVLRIEDTDTDRFVDGACEAIYRTLEMCGLKWDEGPAAGGSFGPYVQSERKDLYKKYAEELLLKGGAYRCFCGKDGLPGQSRRLPSDKCACRDLGEEEIAEKLKENPCPVIRQRVPTEGETSFSDEVYGTVTVPNTELDDQILLKADGMPTYNFANVIDDHLMEISHVIRGNEYLSSTPKYNLLYAAFGWTPPEYIHVEQIMRDKRHKLSKRDGDAYFEDLIKKGYIVPGILNYIALLGWSPRGENTEKEIFTPEELVKVFDAAGLSKSPAIFDEVKMRAINAAHIRALTNEQFKELAENYVSEKSRNCANADLLYKLMQPRTELLTDIAELSDFVGELPEYDVSLYVNKKMKTTPETSLAALKEILPVLERIDGENFNENEVHTALSALAERLGVKNGYILYPLRVALSGKIMTPGGGTELCAVLGKTETLKRVEKGVAKLEKD